jgi:hypothetical protein
LWLHQCSRELEILSPVDPSSLVIARRREPKSDLFASWKSINREEIGACEIGAVGRKSIDLVRSVRALPACPHAFFETSSTAQQERRERSWPICTARARDGRRSRRSGHIGRLPQPVCRRRHPTEWHATLCPSRRSQPF